jgi:hypothetical protein
MLKTRAVQFVIVFKVPKRTEVIKLRGIAWAEPNMNWLTAEIGDVLREVSFRIQSLLGQNDTARKFARSIAEEWELPLPLPN